MKFAVLDFETTGSQEMDSIIQAGLAIIENGKVTDLYGTFVHTKQKIPLDIQLLTGIKNADLHGAPSLREVMQKLAAMLDGAVLVAHHASFDVGFLQRSFQQCNMPRFKGRVLDSIELVRICFPTLAGLNLGMLANHFGVAHDRPHQADSDAQATAEIMIRCLERIGGWPLLVVQRISEVLQRANNSDLGWFFQQMKELQESQTALDLKSHRYYRRFSLAVSDWGDSAAAGAEESDTNGTSGADEPFAQFYLKMKDKLRAKFANYEQRPAQDEMIAAVYEALESERHLIVEAGTGTGKSLAYLIATVFYALIQEEKVIVSTHTINLMEQLVSRDVPLLQELWPESFRAAIVKGRGHYLCLRKFEQTITANEFAPLNDYFVAAAQMLVWLNETETGDDEELQFWQKGKEFWRLVESDSQSCLNRACPWYKKCFYHRARNEAGQADLIVTNHSLVFSDLQTDSKILPPYRHIVIDEAHHFEATASKHFGVEVTHSGFLHTIYRLYRDHRSGQLVPFRNRLQSFSDPDISNLSVEAEEMAAELVQVKEHWEQLNEAMLQSMVQAGARSDGEQDQSVYRLKAGQPPADWPALQLIAEQVVAGCVDVFKRFERISRFIQESEYESEFAGVLTDLGGTLAQLQRYRDGILFFFALANPDYVYWLESLTRNQGKSLHYFAQPIEVSGMLRERFFEQKETVIMTSATLTVDQSFEHITDQLGLTEAATEGQLCTVQLQSPFAYERQALLCIPEDFPELRGSRADSQWIQQLVESLTATARVTGGKMLVLFTSNAMLRQVYDRLQQAASKEGIQVLGQNVSNAGRSKLTKMFREHERCILLGTSSFWEGVDIPGEALSCLAIVRLPFTPPNQPLFEAKSEHLKKNNKNAFMQLAVPQAVIRFKQGFGRLIRTAGDRGVVLLYDTRVITNRYGKHFLQSLPGPLVEQLPTSQVPERIRQWMKG